MFGPELRPLVLDVHFTPLSLTNNGHTIEHEYEPGSSLTIDGIVYELQQFHFHTYSEHTVGGQRYPMEIHLVFKNAAGQLAVIGMLYTIGQHNVFLASLGDLPRHEGTTLQSTAPINVAHGLTSSYVYYTYEGSLTTPPCSEIVTWIVLKGVAEMSEDQFRAFNGILGNNFRPVQQRDPTFVVRSR